MSKTRSERRLGGDAARDKNNPCNHPIYGTHPLRRFLVAAAPMPEAAPLALSFAKDMAERFGTVECRNCQCQLRLCERCGLIFPDAPCAKHPLAGGVA